MSNDIDTITPPSARIPAVTQATAVEQSRAIAEVQAAVVVAQQMPRDMGAAEADMRDACGRTGLAQRAFYTVPSRGTGPSVHLARELARIFGNVQYGVHELRRDDTAGMSEIQAFAWDVEKNVRSTRTFQVPHHRMKKVKGVPTRDPLIDLTDVYLNNQNIGARAVRECIFTVLPAWFTDTAQDLCHRTLAEGEGKPLSERIADMVRVFAEIDISVDELEAKIGRRRSAWQPVDLAQMTIVYTSIKRGETTKDEAFPVRRTTKDEILSDDQKPTQTGEPGRPARADEPAPLKSAQAATPPAAEGSSDDTSPSSDVQQQEEERRLSGVRRDPAAAPEPEPVEESASGEAAETSTGRDSGPRCTVTQQADINRHFGRLDVTEHAERLWWMNYLADLDDNTVDATKQLKKSEAVKVIAALERFSDRDALDASINQDSLLGDQ